jgi:4-amino-4-deoxy-L-arabinose transferase-like glycosyltransferase
MGLSARLFGVNAWSILVPQALLGVASVALLHATVRRRFGGAAGLLAGAVLALTPVAVLMFRFNNPDALLTLLLVAAAYSLVRALESADERSGTRWMVLVGTLVGLAFLTKMLQAFLVVPGFALVHLVAAPTRWTRRLLQLLGAGVAMVVSAGWWVAVVELWPADSRPYIGGSEDNSILELVLGYNGLGRLTGNDIGAGAPGGGAGPAPFGENGITRLFDGQVGGQIAWLLPAALALLVVLLWLGRRAPRADGQRAQVLMWGAWLLVTGLTFSLMQGIFHEYYTVALAPAVGALVGIGGTTLWRRRDEAAPRVVLAAAVGGTAAWSFVLLARSADLPWLRWVVLAGGIAAGLVLLALRPGSRIARSRRTAAAVASLALASALAGPAAYAVDTATTPHTTAIPIAGPAVDAGQAGPAGMGWGAGPGAWSGGPPPAGTPGRRAAPGRRWRARAASEELPRP